MTNDHKTTLLGAVLAAVMAIHLDWSTLTSGDPVAIGSLVGAIVTAVLGWWIKPGVK